MPRKAVDRVARLVWFVDGEPEWSGVGPNRVAADATVAAVRELQRVEPVDDALVTGFVMLATAVDADPTNAALWGQYRAAEVALRGLGVSADDDALTKFLTGLAGAGDAPVVESGDARRSGRKGR